VKIFFFGLIAAILTSPCFAETSDQAAYLTAMVRKGTCSLQDSNWCPTYAEGTKNGFTMHATSESIKSIMDLNYQNITPFCLIWKLAGGRADALAQLAITDKKGRIIVLSRRCDD
jgi:hypothetical protein